MSYAKLHPANCPQPIFLCLCLLLTGCGDPVNNQSNSIAVSSASFTSPTPLISHIHQQMDIDLSAYFIDSNGDELSFTLQNDGAPNMSLLENMYSGAPDESGVYEINIAARNTNGWVTNGSFIFVIEADEDDLPLPVLPGTHDDFEGLVDNQPTHFTQAVSDFGNLSTTDNTPAANEIDNPTATLGRVLFYDKRLSANNTISCATCHQQEHGFSDPRALSLGFKGEETGRHSPGLSNNAYYQRGRFFWDERANTLEEQVLLPIQSSVEMGMELDDLVNKLDDTVFYPDLFEDAFGSDTINEERIALALAQFVRSMLSYNSDFDSVFDASGNPNFAGLSDSERRGLQLFSGDAGIAGRNLRCDQCHTTVAQVSDTVHNIGLDSSNTLDDGAGNGEFKAPSLRNVGLRSAFMHDGRFSSLREVVQHYSTGIQNNPDLDNRLTRRGTAIRFNLSNTEINDLVAFLESLSDGTSTERSLHQDPFLGVGTVLEIAN